MSILISLITVLFLTSCGNPESGTLQSVGSGVIYGEGETADNRADASIEEILKNNNILHDEATMLLELSKSTAGMVQIGKHVTAFPDGSVIAKKMLKTFKEVRTLCEDERFSKQFSLPVCTGFLVAPDLLVTAGHCVNKTNYHNRAWIFGYDQSRATDSLPTFKAEFVYHTKEVLEWKEDRINKSDFALVRLDRAVTIADPLKFRSYGEASVGTELAIIGHPNGLPTKISADAQILENKPNAYKTNLDSFGGNSGSPVFNLYTGEVEGILISGATDFLPNFTRGCVEVNRKKDAEGAEYVAKISLVNLAKYIEKDFASNF
ncbi:MAG: hypothetical protein DRQ89_02760 [Epsilonproteobacteria bacterium]|nr:MAG: hypothetical protein DRQ89_02760 [Campylobacterota bacterium]